MSAKDLKILFIVVGLGALAVVYFWVYKPTVEKNTALKSDNATLKQRVEYLQGLVAQEETFRSETERMDAEVEQILQEFPSYLMIENEIMNVVDSEDVTNAEISNFTIGDPAIVPVDTGTESTLEGDGSTVTSAAAGQYSLYNMNTSISYTASYEGMKELINFVADDNDKHSVVAFSATLDNSTGDITGVMSYDAFFIFGQDKDYVGPDLPDIDHGTENIFGSIDLDSGKSSKKSKSKDKTEGTDAAEETPAETDAAEEEAGAA
jgi:hypothetical protein